MLNSVFQTRILLLQPEQQLLKKGTNNKDSSDNYRVRADFLEGKDYASIDVRVIGDHTYTAASALQAEKVQLLLKTLLLAEGGNPDRQLEANNKYQLLIVLIRKLDDQPLGFPTNFR